MTCLLVLTLWTYAGFTGNTKCRISCDAITETEITHYRCPNHTDEQHGNYLMVLNGNFTYFTVDTHGLMNINLRM